jgi:tetratricopeptide (TPR) repeat protein
MPRSHAASRRYWWIAVLLSIVSSSAAFGQLSSELDLKYQYPFAAGIGYRSASPVTFLGTDYGAEYQSVDVSGFFRLPLPGQPVLQPQIQLGFRSVQSIDRLDPEQSEQSNHTHFYAMPGLVFSRRLSKTFEVGADASVGLSEALFPIIDDGEPRSSLYLLASLGVRATIGLSFNFVLDINPYAAYQRAFTPLTQFNGFYFGIGVSGSYRGGVDPDAPQANIRAIQFDEVDFPPALFAAMQNYYVNHPIGTVTITNTESYPITEVELSFFQAGYMDLESVVATIPEMAPGEQREIDITARFNRNVFDTQGTLNLNGEIRVSYLARTREVEQIEPVSYDLYDKTALTWDDLLKVGAFITAQDSALQNYTTTIHQFCSDVENMGLPENLQIAMEIYSGLRELGVLYEKDVTSPFDLAQENPVMVDNISLPRDTLGGAGDCDDLTVLYCALLETQGIATGYITLPGHIYPVFNTGVAAGDYRLVHPDNTMTLTIDQTLWVPIEITMINSEDFLEAWSTGASEWASHDNAPAERALTQTADAQAVFRPVTLVERDLGLLEGSAYEIAEDFRRAAEDLVATILDSYQTEARESGRKQGYNRLGIAAAQLSEYDMAIEAFAESLRLDANYMAPKVNLANVYFLMGEYTEALRFLHDAEEELTQAAVVNTRTLGKVLLALRNTYYELENDERVAEYSARLAEVDPELAAANSYLASVSASGGSRSSEVRGPSVQFVLDEEVE